MLQVIVILKRLHKLIHLPGSSTLRRASFFKPTNKKAKLRSKHNQVLLTVTPRGMYRCCGGTFRVGSSQRRHLTETGGRVRRSRGQRNERSCTARSTILLRRGDGVAGVDAIPLCRAHDFRIDAAKPESDGRPGMVSDTYMWSGAEEPQRLLRALHVMTDGCVHCVG